VGAKLLVVGVQDMGSRELFGKSEARSALGSCRRNVKRQVRRDCSATQPSQVQPTRSTGFKHHSSLTTAFNNPSTHHLSAHQEIEYIMEGSHRLFRFPKPAWMNNANTRTAGVYIAGALVRSLIQTHLFPITDNIF
jgi:hypothetical protein